MNERARRQCLRASITIGDGLRFGLGFAIAVAPMAFALAWLAG